MSKPATILKRRAFLINFFYFAVIIMLFYLFMHYAFWITFPFLAAFAIAMFLQRPVGFITRKTPIKRGFASVIMVILLLIAFLGPISLIIAKIISEFMGFFDYIKNILDNLPQFLEQFEISLADAVAFLPDGIEKKIMDTFASISATLSGTTGPNLATPDLPSIDFSMLKAPLMGVWNTAKQIPSALVSVLIAIIACCFMTADFPRIAGFIKRQLPPEKKHVIREAKNTVFSSLKKIVKAYLLIMLITFSEMFIGLNILKLIGVYESSYIFVISFVTCVVDIVPVLGTGTIVLPWAVYSFIMGDVGMGIGLLVIYGVITVIRQIIEPKLVAMQLGLPPFITIIAMFFGLKLFGFIGLFLLPLLITMLKVLNDNGTIHLWNRPCDVEEETAPVTESMETSQEES